MKKTLVHEHLIPGQYAVAIHQTGLDRFTVTYGQQVRSGLNYAKAAQEYGACVFHALACAGLLDNSNSSDE